MARHVDDADQRVVRLGLTALGDSKLTALSGAHLEELARERARFTALWEHLPIDR